MKTNTENRTVFHTSRYTPAESAELVEHAQACGLSVSALLRRRGLLQRLPSGAAPQINLTTYKDVTGSTSNLNQLLHHLNSCAVAGVPHGVTLDQVNQTLLDLVEKVKKVRLELIGASS